MKRAKQQRRMPRNPLVPLVLFKKSGAHAKTVKAQRRADKMMTKRTVERGES